jgi:uncharacterized paraquat-inducible protein A
MATAKCGNCGQDVDVAELDRVDGLLVCNACRGGVEQQRKHRPNWFAIVAIAVALLPFLWHMPHHDDRIHWMGVLDGGVSLALAGVAGILYLKGRYLGTLNLVLVIVGLVLGGLNVLIELGAFRFLAPFLGE